MWQGDLTTPPHCGNMAVGHLTWPGGDGILVTRRTLTIEYEMESDYQ